MTPERYQQVGKLCLDALQLEPDRRATFLDQACADHPSLRRQVESLLAYQQQAENFIELPALEVAAKIIAGQQTSTFIGKQIGHYRVLSLLGAGGMGEVYLAQEEQLSRQVALKLLPAQFTQDPDRIARFEREARTASALSHPNIVTVYEIGEADGVHFIATEFIEGQTLRQRMETGSLELNEVIEIGIQIASGLHAAHEAGVVHRDIKPENLMLRQDGYVKVLDFGLAKLTESHAPAFDAKVPTQISSLTDSGMVMGTFSHMSPEQARGQKVDARSDIFSLGVVLYELAAGKAPFEGVNAFEVIAAILERKPLPLSQHRGEVPAELERIINRALEKDREMRHQSASDLRAELKRLQREMESSLTATVSGEGLPASSRSGWKKWKMKAAMALGGLAVLMAAWFWQVRLGDRPAANLYGAANSQADRLTAEVRKASAGKLVGVRWNDKKLYFFRGGEYYRYDVEADRIDADHPKPITGNWQGVWAEGVDAIIISPWDNRKAYLFKGKEYIQYDTAVDRRPGVGSPKPIPDDWPGIWPDGIDAAVVWNDGKIYFFKGSEYIRFDVKSKRSDPGYPQPIADSWPGLWSSNIDTILTNSWPPHLSGKAYFFKDGQYIRYDMVLNEVDDGYPKTISRYWIGLQ